MYYSFNSNDFGIKDTFVNMHTEKKCFYLNRKIFVDNEKEKVCKIAFWGDTQNAGGFLVVNNIINLPINSDSIIDIPYSSELELKIIVSAESSVSIRELSVDLRQDKEDLTERCRRNRDVLVVVPNYPSYVNLYSCAFVHSRNREYLKQGIDFQVISIDSANWYESFYMMEDISVMQGNYGTLKKILEKQKYKTIVVHFVDEKLFSIFDDYTDPIDELIFICHGPETIYRYLENIVRPYFTKPIERTKNDELYALRDCFVKKYAQRDNVEWIFVSEWLRDFSEKELNLKFKNCHVISNVINEELFPYVEKMPEDRKKILILRKFDNISFHSIDQSVRAILELSKREFFDDLSFEIYGDGDYYETLIAPVKELENVHLHRTFIPNAEISKLHREVGILLIPSRHDTQGVAMGEAASSGLVVVGSAVTCVPYFMQQERFHTLAAPDSPKDLADIIERLYKNPDEYLQISKELSLFVRETLNIEQTVLKEVELIKGKIDKERGNSLMNFEEMGEKILSVIVPVEKVDNHLEKCIMSLTNQRNNYKIEILLLVKWLDELEKIKLSKIQNDCKGLVRVITKNDNGKEVTIVEGIRQAKGKYIHLMKNTEWAVSDELARLIDFLDNENVDLVLSNASCMEYEDVQKVNVADYSMMQPEIEYEFGELLFDGYGFKEQGLLIKTVTFRADVFRNRMCCEELKQEFGENEILVWLIKNTKNVKYCDVDLIHNDICDDKEVFSCTLIERCKYSLFEVLNSLNHDTVSALRKKCIYKYVAFPAMMRVMKYYMANGEYGELEYFFEQLDKYSNLCNEMLDCIGDKTDYEVILKKYSHHCKEMLLQQEKKCCDKQKRKYAKQYIKKTIKYLLPYGIVVNVMKYRTEDPRWRK